MKIYKAAAYIRLSKEDREKEVSNSIVNQRLLNTDFVQNKEDIHIVDYFEDDGYSGVFFNRPQFIRIMEVIEKDEVNRDG